MNGWVVSNPWHGNVRKRALGFSKPNILSVHLRASFSVVQYRKRIETHRKGYHDQKFGN